MSQCLAFYSTPCWQWLVHLQQVCEFSLEECVLAGAELGGWYLGKKTGLGGMSEVTEPTAPQWSSSWSPLQSAVAGGCRSMGLLYPSPYLGVPPFPTGICSARAGPAAGSSCCSGCAFVPAALAPSHSWNSSGAFIGGGLSSPWSWKFGQLRSEKNKNPFLLRGDECEGSLI